MFMDVFPTAGLVLGMPPDVSGVRVRFQGVGGRGQVQVELCNRRAARVPPTDALDRPWLEEAVIQLLDAWLPDWTSGRFGSGSLLIDLATGESRIESEGAGQGRLRGRAG